jgi:hypothetical protein
MVFILPSFVTSMRAVRMLMKTMWDIAIVLHAMEVPVGARNCPQKISLKCRVFSVIHFRAVLVKKVWAIIGIKKKEIDTLTSAKGLFE